MAVSTISLRSLETSPLESSSIDNALPIRANYRSAWTNAFALFTGGCFDGSSIDLHQQPTCCLIALSGATVEDEIGPRVSGEGAPPRMNNKSI
jgi:hypothetical protein